MRRRALLLGGAASAMLAAARGFAQRAGREYRLAVVLPMPEEIGKRYLGALRERMAGHGFLEGRNLRIDSRFVPYGSRPNIDAVRELVALNPDAMLTGSTLVSQAAQKATSTIPVIFTWVSDPLVSGIVKDYARPGANFSGVSVRFFELSAKRLGLVRELLPSAKRVAIVSGVFDSVLESAMTYIGRAADQLGLQLVRVTAGSEWEKAMHAVRQESCDAALLIVPFAVLGLPARAEEVARHAIAQRVPAIFSELESVPLGGLMSYATDLNDDLRRGADLLARVLRGENPGNLPVDQSAHFELAVNLRTARAIGMEIPRSMLLRADRVIE